MPASDYAAIPSTGKLKLKGGLAPSTDSKVSKKKKKHKTKDATVATEKDDREDSKEATEEHGTNESTLSKALRDEDGVIANNGGEQSEGREIWRRGKTEAERKWEEQRRKRVRAMFYFAKFICLSAPRLAGFWDVSLTRVATLA